MRVIVFTAILGGSDCLKQAPVGVDAVCFTDDLSQDAKGWTLVPTGIVGDPRRQAWNLRCRPDVYLGPHDLSIWTDASFTVTDLPLLLKHSAKHPLSALKHQARHSCYEEAAEIIRIGQADAKDVTPQMDRYRAEGFKPDSLSISCVIVRQNIAPVQAFNQLWEREIQQHKGDNTQLSIEYAAWKSGLTIHRLEGVRKDNPYASHDHRDHKKRRKPYDTAAA